MANEVKKEEKLSEIVHDTISGIGDAVGTVAEAGIDGVMGLGGNVLKIVARPFQFAAGSITRALSERKKLKKTIEAEKTAKTITHPKVENK